MVGKLHSSGDILSLIRHAYTGPIAVELYQGAKTQNEIEVLDNLIQTIKYVEITRAHFHKAGIFSQKAARLGKTFSTIDVILAVVAEEEQLLLFSLDSHFKISLSIAE